MKNGKCPKCNSTDVFKREGGVGYGQTTLEIVDSPIGSKPVTIRPTKAEAFVCVNCGYLENYIVDKNILETIQKKWKVP